MPNLSADERAAFAAFKKQTHLEFSVRLGAMEMVIAALLWKIWNGQVANIVAAVLGSALISVSVHRTRVGSLLHKIKASDQNTLAALAALTDLARDAEKRRLPLDGLTRIVVLACVAVAGLLLLF